jgi:hypothetical protein
MGDRDPLQEDGEAAPDEAGRDEQPITSAPHESLPRPTRPEQALAGFSSSRIAVSGESALSRALVEGMYSSLTDDAAMRGR